MRIFIEGATAHDNSYGIVNLRLAEALRARGHEVALRPWDQSYRGAATSAAQLDIEPFELGVGHADVWLRQVWPPSFERPDADRAFVIQPFELGAVPARWVLESGQLDGVLVPSLFAKQTWLQGGADHRHVWVVPNGVVVPDVVPVPEPSNDVLTVGYVGGAIWRKGIDILVSGLDLLEDATLRRIELVVKVAGYDTYYAGQSLLEQELLAHPRVAARTEIVRQSLPQAGIDALYQRFDVLAAPYRAEGFAMPILEAMAHGVVPIVPDAGPAPEFVDRTCGVLLASRPLVVSGPADESLGPALGPRWAIEVEARDVASAVAALIDDVDGRAVRARAGLERARAWSWDRAAGVLEGVLDALEAGEMPSDTSSRLLLRAARGGPQAIGALVELGDLHGARELAAATPGAEVVHERLDGLAGTRPDVWCGALHRAAIPARADARSSWHAGEGDLAIVTRVARFLAPLLAVGGGRILDLGSGHGAMLGQLRSLGVAALGVELDPVRAEHLRTSGFDVVEGDALEVLGTLETGGFGGAFVGHLIEHFAPHRAATLLGELARVVRTGGVVVIQTPDPAAAGVIQETFWLDPTHVRPYPAATIAAMAAEAGFAAVGPFERSLAPLVADTLVVLRRRGEPPMLAPRRTAQVAPVAVVMADPRSGFRRASDAFLSELNAMGIGVRADPLVRPRLDRVFLHDLPIGSLASGLVGTAVVARTAWEARGVPRKLLRALARYRLVLTYSNWSRDALVEAGLASDRIGVWPPRVALELDPAVVADLRGSKEPAGRVLAIADWSARKNLEGLVRAFLRARGRVGQGSLVVKVRRIEASSALSWLDRIVSEERGERSTISLVADDVTPAALRQLYLDADVYCLPTRGEGFGLPFLEAMAHGCAVIAPVEGGHRDVVDASQWLVPGRYEPAHLDLTAPFHDSVAFRGAEWFEVDPDALVEVLAEAMVDHDAVRARGSLALELAARAARATVAEREQQSLRSAWEEAVSYVDVR